MGVRHTFSELDPVSFSVYQEWLYRQQICIPDKEEAIGWQKWLAAYIFGAQIKDNIFCDAVLEAGLQIHEKDEALSNQELFLGA